MAEQFVVCSVTLDRPNCHRWGMGGGSKTSLEPLSEAEREAMEIALYALLMLGAGHAFYLGILTGNRNIIRGSLILMHASGLKIFFIIGLRTHLNVKSRAKLLWNANLQIVDSYFSIHEAMNSLGVCHHEVKEVDTIP